MKIGIVTDSLSDLPPKLAQEYGISIVPGVVYIDNQRYISGVDISTEEILKFIGKKNIRTATPSPGEYNRHYEPLMEKNDYIVSLHCPVKHSAFIKSAKIGAKRLKKRDKIIHIECGVATLGLGLTALTTSLIAKNIDNVDELITQVKSLCQRIEVIGTVGSFEYIKRSGRIKLKVAGMLASAISIKPVLAMQGTDIFLLEKPRTREKALSKLIYHFNKRINTNFKPKIIGIGQLGSKSDAKNIQEMISLRYSDFQIITTGVDPMIASHTGPGLILITFFGHNKGIIGDRK